MSKPGFTVMVNALFGDDRGGELVEASKGKRISACEIVMRESYRGRLRLAFEDGSAFMLSDEGQSCCEHRYMSTDDDLSAFVGAALREIELRDGPDTSGEYDTHETQFLIITTDRGAFTIVNHNEHNGYYGGFWLKALAEEQP